MLKEETQKQEVEEVEEKVRLLLEKMDQKYYFFMPCSDIRGWETDSYEQAVLLLKAGNLYRDAGFFPTAMEHYKRSEEKDNRSEITKEEKLELFRNYRDRLSQGAQPDQTIEEDFRAFFNKEVNKAKEEICRYGFGGREWEANYIVLQFNEKYRGFKEVSLALEYLKNVQKIFAQKGEDKIIFNFFLPY
jgi:hypothetical protein